MDINSRKNSLFIVMGAGIIFALVMLFQVFIGEDEYRLEMKKYREDRDTFFKTESSSPMPDSVKKTFEGLDYYPVDKKFRVTARFTKHPRFEYYMMPLTSGKPDKLVIAGRLDFRIDGQNLTLTAFLQNEKDSKRLFVPFRDATSGKTTYGGGRYMDVRRVDRRVTLDFNKAYNPDCVYDVFSRCPVPPEENTLPFPIEAGEKDFKLKL